MQGTNKRLTRSGSSTNPVVKSEVHTPDVMRSTATPVSTTSPKVPANKSNSKPVTKNLKYDSCDNDPEKESILKQIDQSVKDDLWNVGFAKWRRRWLTIVQLGPYNIGPGPVGDDWMELFHKVHSSCFFTGRFFFTKVSPVSVLFRNITRPTNIQNIKPTQLCD